jgi:hypothetical protein
MSNDNGSQDMSNDSVMLQRFKELYSLKIDKSKIIKEKVKILSNIIYDVWICRKSSKTLDYIQNIKNALEYYSKDSNLNVYEFNNYHGFMLYYTRACFIFSQKIDKKQIAIPRKISVDEKSKYIDNVNDLVETWSKLEHYYSFDNILKIYQDDDRDKVTKLCEDSVYNFNRYIRQPKNKKQLQRDLGLNKKKKKV